MWYVFPTHTEAESALARVNGSQYLRGLLSRFGYKVCSRTGDVYRHNPNGYRMRVFVKGATGFTDGTAGVPSLRPIIESLNRYAYPEMAAEEIAARAAAIEQVLGLPAPVEATHLIPEEDD